MNFVLVRELNRKKVTRTSSDLVVLFVFGYVLTLYNIGSLSSDGARWTHGLSLVMHKCRLERTRCSVESFGFWLVRVKIATARFTVCTLVLVEV